MSETMSWMDHPSVRQMNPRKLEIAKEFVDQVQGKSPMASMSVLLQTQKKMQEQGLTFTPEESGLLTDILTADMTPAEKVKVAQMRQMVEKYQKSGK